MGTDPHTADTPDERPQPRRWRRRAAAVAILLLLVPLSAEMGSRLILAVRTGDTGYLSYPSNAPVEMLTVTDRSATDLPPPPAPARPGSSYVRYQPGIHEFRLGPSGPVEHEITINADGFRGRTFGDPGGGRRELVCMGGSAVFSGLCPEGQSWPEVLEAGWEQKLGPGQISVINRGLPGMSLRDVGDLFVSDVAVRRPDLVVVYSAYNSIFQGKVVVDLRPQTTSFVHRMLWGRSLYYTTMLNRHLVRTQVPKGVTAAIESQVSAYVEDLERLTARAKEHDVALLYVVQAMLDPDRIRLERIRGNLEGGRLDEYHELAPMFRERLATHSALNEALIEHAAAHGVPLVDPRPALLDCPWPEDHFQVALHLTPAGAQQLAAEIARQVDEHHGSLDALIGQALAGTP